MTKQFTDDNGNPIAMFRPQATINVAYTGTKGDTAGVETGVKVVRIYCTSDAFIRINAAATAAAGMPVKAEVETYLPINEGEYVSAIQQSAGGTLYVTPMK